MTSEVLFDAGRRSALILSGGPFHDFTSSSARLADILSGLDIDADIRTDVNIALTEVGDHDLLVVNCMRWAVAEYHAEQRETWYLRLDASARTALMDYIGAGRPVLAMHSAVISFDDFPQWSRWLGATWVFGRSGHPPISLCDVTATSVDDPPVEVRSFQVYDERYHRLEIDERVKPLATVEVDGLSCPVIWTREIGRARIAVDLLGHGHESLDHARHRELIADLVRWACDSDQMKSTDRKVQT